MLCVVIYREHDADTSVNGPYETIDQAVRARDYLAAEIVLARRNAGNDVTVQPSEDEWSQLTIYDPDYEHCPSDDDWHVVLYVDGMGQPVHPVIDRSEES